MGEGAVERWTGPLERLHPDDREALVAALPEETLRRWVESFGEWAHAGQTAPAGADWRTWVIMGGRGFGKTRAGAEWVLEAVRAAKRAEGGGGRHASKSHDVGRGLGPAGRASRTTLRSASFSCGGSQDDPRRNRCGCFLPDLTGLATAAPA